MSEYTLNRKKIQAWLANISNQWPNAYFNMVATHRGDSVPIHEPNKAGRTMVEFRGKYQLVKLNKPFTLPGLTWCWSVYTNPATGNKTQTNALRFLSLKKTTQSDCVWWQVGSHVCSWIKWHRSMQSDFRAFFFLKRIEWLKHLLNNARVNTVADFFPFKTVGH